MPVTFDQIAAQPTLWLSRKPAIPLADVTLFFGAGAIGKGRMFASLIASVTRGDPLGLSEEGGEPGDCVVIFPEDKPDEQVVPRLRAAGADLSRVHDMTRLDSGSRFKLSASERHEGHLAHLRAYIEHLQATGRNPRLVVIDPLAAVLGWGSMATNPGARRLVEPLQDMADMTGVAVAVVGHTTKAGVLQGSAGLMQALRTVYRVSVDPQNEAQRIITVEKANNLPPQDDLRFTIAQDDDGTAKVQWLDREALEAQRQSWRERLAARQAGKPTAAQAKAAGCRHSSTKFGTLAQCGDCPARRLKAAPAASGATQSVSRPSGAVVTSPPRRERRWGAAVSADGDHKPVGAGKFASEAAAKAACEGVAGPLVWRELPGKAGTIVASTAEGTVYAVAAG